MPVMLAEYRRSSRCPTTQHAEHNTAGQTLPIQGCCREDNMNGGVFVGIIGAPEWRLRGFSWVVSVLAGLRARNKLGQGPMSPPLSRQLEVAGHQTTI